jgi:hypothetical protein
LNRKEPAGRQKGALKENKTALDENKRKQKKIKENKRKQIAFRKRTFSMAYRIKAFFRFFMRR